jgi:hypothetical protein
MRPFRPRDSRHSRGWASGPHDVPNANVHIHGVPAGEAAALKNEIDEDAIGEYVEIVIIPVAGGAKGRGAPESEVILLHRPKAKPRTEFGAFQYGLQMLQPSP